MRSIFALAAVLLIAPASQAHFTMLLLDNPSVKKGDKVTLTYQFGHPFEHELFDAPEPNALWVIGPDGKKTDLKGSLEKFKTKGEKPATAYRLTFTPQERGDYTFYLMTPPIWVEQDKEFIQDVARVALHVQVQKNWYAQSKLFTDTDYVLAPLTRPYGLQAGMVFQARAFRPDVKYFKNIAGALVEFERYNASPPKVLPPDEHRTYAAYTDENGVVTGTLPQPGWWGITVQKKTGTQQRDGKEHPFKQRATIWVFVDEKLSK